MFSRTACLLCLLLPALLAGAGDPGVVLELDRERFALQARDLRDGEPGPTLKVALGSPAHPTPVGAFPIFQVVRNPGWKPGDTARRHGALPIPPSSQGPLGVAKIQFAGEGMALHGGAEPLLLGKPVSLGCIRLLDEDLLALLGWLDERSALGAARHQPGGEIHREFRRPARVVVR
jgi:hypothetical protein